MKLITQNLIISLASVYQNIDPEIIKDAFIEVAQEEHILPVLTSDLYDLIVSENNASTFTGLNETLLNDYIKPALAFMVMSDIITLNAVRFADAGIMINTSDTSDSAPREDRADLSKKYKKMGGTLLEKMQRFLDDNKTSFPLWKNQSSLYVENRPSGGIIM